MSKLCIYLRVWECSFEKYYLLENTTLQRLRYLCSFLSQKVLQLDVLNHCQIVNADACIGCGQCELRCPDYAIFVDKEEN